MAPSRPVTLLKRPASSATAVSNSSSPAAAPKAVPSALSERVSDAVRAAIDGALSRERSRMEASYRARQEALLRAVADVLRTSLQTVVAESSRQEASVLSEALRNLEDRNPASSTDLSENSGKPGVAKPPSFDDKATAVAFKQAFEKELLGSFEASIRGMLAALAEKIDHETQRCLAKPAEASAARLMKSTVAIREAVSDLSLSSKAAQDTLTSKLAQLSANGAALAESGTEKINGGTMEQELTSRVALLSEENFQGAIKGTRLMSPELRQKLASAAVMSPYCEDYGNVTALATIDIVFFAEAVSNRLEDNTAARLEWLNGLAMSLDGDGDGDAIWTEIDETEAHECEAALLNVIRCVRTLDLLPGASGIHVKKGRKITSVLYESLLEHLRQRASE